jgi:hypothetical protein
MKGHYDKLDRKTQTRHFPSEFGNGKGDHLRKQTKVTKKNYEKGFERIKWGTLKSKYSD